MAYPAYGIDDHIETTVLDIVLVASGLLRLSRNNKLGNSMIYRKLHNSGGTMKNEQILKYRNLFEKAAEFALFLDGIEASCSRESNAAFLYIHDEDEPDAPEHRENDVAQDIPLRSKVLEFLVERTIRADESDSLHRMMLTHGDRPVYVRALHLVRDFWWEEIEVRMPSAGREECWELDHETVLNIAYLKGSERRIRR